MSVIPTDIVPMGVKQDIGEILVIPYVLEIVNGTVNKTEVAMTANLVTGEIIVINNARISVMETCVIMKMVDVYKDVI